MSDTCKTCQYKGRQEQAVKDNAIISPCGLCIHGNLRDFYTPVKSAFQEWSENHPCKIPLCERGVDTHRKEGWNAALDKLLSTEIEEHEMYYTAAQIRRLKE